MDTKDKLNALHRMIIDETKSLKMLNELLDYIEGHLKPSDEEFGHIVSSLSSLLKQKAAEVAEIYTK